MERFHKTLKKELSPAEPSKPSTNGYGDGWFRGRSHPSSVRRGLDLLGPFPEVGGLDLPDGVVLDTDIVAFDDHGVPSFSLLQRRTGFGGAGTGARDGVNLVVFDVLFHGADGTALAYEERRDILTHLALAPPIVVPEPRRHRAPARSSR